LTQAGNTNIKKKCSEVVQQPKERPPKISKIVTITIFFLLQDKNHQTRLLSSIENKDDEAAKHIPVVKYA
jgi:hypothetical protein